MGITHSQAPMQYFPTKKEEKRSVREYIYFGIKYHSAYNMDHILNVFKKNAITTDWEGKLFFDLTFD